MNEQNQTPLNAYIKILKEFIKELKFKNTPITTILFLYLTGKDIHVYTTIHTQGSIKQNNSKCVATHLLSI